LALGLKHGGKGGHLNLNSNKFKSKNSNPKIEEISN
jgi:hypothetical protein